MKTKFADTSFYVAVTHPRDAWHAKAVVLGASRDPVVTTEFVLVEVANFFSQSAEGRGLFAALVGDLYSAPGIEIVPASPFWFDRGLKLYMSRPDKEWSLTDCISFEVMAARGLTDALTADHHFDQAGFRALLR